MPKTGMARGFRQTLKRKSFPSISWANVIFPDLIGIPTKISHSETSALARKDEDHFTFRDFHYYVVRCEFSLTTTSNLLESLGIKLESIAVRLTILNKQQNTIVHIVQIFPRDELVQIGEVVKEYSLMADFSLKLSNLGLTIPPLGINLPSVTAEGKQLRKIKYDLKIPKVSAGTAGNNEVDYTFYFNQYLEPHSQYRMDMIVGFPKEVSKEYQLEFDLSGRTNGYLNPNTIIHVVPLKFLE